MDEQPTRIKDILDEKLENLENNQDQESDAGTLQTEEENAQKPKHGGARPNSGRPKGSLSKKNLTVLQAKTRFVERVNRHVDELFDSQLDLAKGEKILMVKITERDDKGNVKKVYHEIVEDPETIANYMNYTEGYNTEWEVPHTDEEYYYITTKPANNQAIQGMLDRAFGKAPEKIEVEGGFFKANTLNIQIVNTPATELHEKEIIEVETETDGTDGSNAQTEPQTEPSA